MAAEPQTEQDILKIFFDGGRAEPEICFWRKRGYFVRAYGR